MYSERVAVRTFGHGVHVSCSPSIGLGHVCGSSTIDAGRSGEGVMIREESRKDTGDNVERLCPEALRRTNLGSSNAYKPVTVLLGGTKGSRRWYRHAVCMSQESASDLP